MLYGAPAHNLDDIFRLQLAGFDFSEISFSNAKARHVWWESGLINPVTNRFFLLAHGPLEDYPNDARYMWNHHVPNLIATIDTLRRMYIRSLNIHLLMDPRVVSHLVLLEKKRALEQLVQSGKQNSVDINLENTSETPQDLAHVLREVPHLGLTLDVGHANLQNTVNISTSIIEESGEAIRHVHLHDNHGGSGQQNDLHLGLGHGTVDFIAIIRSLRNLGYDSTMTLEVKPEFQESSLSHIKKLLNGIPE